MTTGWIVGIVLIIALTQGWKLSDFKPSSYAAVGLKTSVSAKGSQGTKISAGRVEV